MMKSVSINLFFIRHGQTTANRDEILQGQCDYPLTDRGIDELKATGTKLKDVKFGLCFVSDLTRAKDSAKYLMSNLSDASSLLTPPIELRHLREQSFGVREAQSKHKTSEEIRRIMAQEQFGDSERWTEIVDPAETHADVRLRQEQTLVMMAEHITTHVHQHQHQQELHQHSDNNFSDDSTGSLNVLIVSHGGYIRQFLRNFCSRENLNEFGKIDNGAVSIVHCTHHHHRKHHHHHHHHVCEQQQQRSETTDTNIKINEADVVGSHIDNGNGSSFFTDIRAELDRTNMINSDDVFSALNALGLSLSNAKDSC